MCYSNTVFKPCIDFLSLSFLITGLCNSLARSSFTLTLDRIFLSKSLYTMLAHQIPIASEIAVNPKHVYPKYDGYQNLI